jgi:hypothetical protein
VAFPVRVAKFEAPVAAIRYGDELVGVGVLFRQQGCQVGLDADSYTAGGLIGREGR